MRRPFVPRCLVPGRLPRSRGRLLLAAALGCGPVPAPDWPQDAPEPAAAACEPPYARFAPGRFQLADLDIGRSCSVFLEQDECVLGVYRDCSVPTEAPREWRGWVDGPGRLRLDALFPVPPTLPRSPRCCEGSLVRDEGPTWALLRCGFSGCGGSIERGHAGLYLEAEVPADPAFELGPLGPPIGPLVDARGRWLLIGGGDGAGLWLAGDAGPTHRFEGGTVLAVDPDGAPWVAVAHQLRRPGGQLTALPGPALALDADRSGAVVALGDRLVRVSADRVVERPLIGVEPAGLALLDSGEAVLVGADRIVRFDAALEPVGTLLAGDAWVGRPRAATRLGPWVAFVARCHTAAAGEHCLFTFSPETEELRRVGLPDGRRLGRPVAGTDGRWWVPDESGRIHVVEPGSLRPELYRRVEGPEGLAALIEGPQGGLAVLGDGRAALVR